jgi:hypothetical protein
VLEVGGEDCLGAVDHEEGRVAHCLAGRRPQAPQHRWELVDPFSAKLVQIIEDSKLDSLQDHAVGVLDLPIHAGVRHGGLIDMDVVFNLRNFFPVNFIPLSVMMEFGTPNQWMISVKKNTACSDLILASGHASIHLENLSMVMSRWV